MPLPFIFRIFDFDLKPAQIFENVPSPVLTKSYTGIDKIVYQYCPNRIPVLAKSLPALMKSYTSIGKIIYQYWRNHIPALTTLFIRILKFGNAVYDFVNANIRFR